MQFLQIAFGIIVLSNVLSVLWTGLRNKLSFMSALLLLNPLNFLRFSKLNIVEQRAVSITILHSLLAVVTMFTALVLL